VACLVVKVRPNNSFNRSGMSLAFIVNLSHDAVDSRPVNSGVRHASHSQSSCGLDDAARRTECSVE
jgi:hypothetical protein